MKNCQTVSNEFENNKILKHNFFRMSGMKRQATSSAMLPYELAMEESDAKYRAGLGNLSCTDAYSTNQSRFKYHVKNVFVCLFFVEKLPMPGKG